MTAFFSVFFILIIMSVLMWGFFRFMYPKPPKAFMPQAGDIITPRDCSLCGYPLAEYRGVLESKPEQALDASQREQIAQLTAEIAALQHAVEVSKATLFPTAKANAGDSNLTQPKATTSEQSGVPAMNRQQRKQAKRAYEQQQQTLHEKQQALKKITTWFFCNYEHQASFHEQQTGTNLTEKS